jgi:hypothetical protein
MPDKQKPQAKGDAHKVHKGDAHEGDAHNGEAHEDYRAKMLKKILERSAETIKSA